MDRLLADGHLERVSPDRDLADHIMAQADAHLSAAIAVLDTDPIGSFQLAYDAVRKAYTAVLENQGIRATSRGGHRAVVEAFRAQFDPPMHAEADEFNWMRQVRNRSEYPTFDQPEAERADAERAHEIAGRLVPRARLLLDQMPVYGR